MADYCCNWGQEGHHNEGYRNSKWFNVSNVYCFINRIGTKKDVFLQQTAIKKNNPRKHLCSVGHGETVEFNIVEGEKSEETAMLQDMRKFQFKAVNTHQTKTIIDATHFIEDL